MKVSRFVVLSVVLLLVVLGFSLHAHADLELLGQGTSTHGTYNLIYDTDLDITWYDYSRSPNTWYNQVDWADALSVNFGGNVYEDWRLPTTVDGLWVYGTDGTTTAGYNITTSEMGHLFYTEMGNDGKYDTSGNETGCGSNPPSYCLTNTADFQNFQSLHYWSGTGYAADPVETWYFTAGDGYQGNHYKSSTGYGLAVMDGLAVVPEPISSTLFIVGSATLGFRRFCKKRSLT